MSHEVVWFERRGGIRLGAVTGGGASKLVLLDEDGASVRLPKGRVLHTLNGRVEEGSPQSVREGLRSLRVEAQGLDEDLLWSSLEDGRDYALGDLAELYYGEVSDERVAALVAGLTVPQTGRLASSFRLSRGAIKRVDAATREQIQARLVRETEDRERRERFVAWVATWGEQAPVAPEGTLAEDLALLSSYALSADRCAQLKAARALARRLEWGDPDGVLSRLERSGVLPRHVNEVLARHGVREAFSSLVRAQADALAEAEDPLPGEDLTELPTVAIDDADTREVDDALSAWEEDGALHLAVHIARVADAIQPQSALDDEAAKRATTVYFPGQTLRMLPERLTDALFSLEANCVRPALSLICRVGADGLPGPGRFVRSSVRVDERATYEAGGPINDAVLAKLLPVAQALLRRRAEDGATTLSLPPLKVTLDGEGEPVLEFMASGLASNLVVSELMVLYNARLADALAAGGAAAFFRRQAKDVAHDVPADDPLFGLKVRRALPPTSVASKPGPHKTMGLAAYTQATSPIRRFGDLVAQRQLLALLDGREPIYDRAAVTALRESTQPAARRARVLEDERRRYWIARWFENRVGSTLPAVVSRAGPRGGAAYLTAVDREYPCAGLEDLEVGTSITVRIEGANPRARSVSLRAVDVEEV